MKLITVTFYEDAEGWGFEIVKDNVKAKPKGYPDEQTVEAAAGDNLKYLKNNHKIINIWPCEKEIK